MFPETKWWQKEYIHVTDSKNSRQGGHWNVAEAEKLSKLQLPNLQ